MARQSNSTSWGDPCPVATLPTSLSWTARVEPQTTPRANIPLDTARGAALPFPPTSPAITNLSASGALLDAITWLKPIIANRIPFVANLFERYGDIGYLCDDPDQMVQKRSSA